MTPKMEAFVLAMAETGNQSEAYRRAYNTANMKPATVTRKAAELMKDGRIRARLAELNRAAVTAAVMTRSEALERLSVIARADLAELIDFGETVVGTDENGDPVIQTTWKIKDSAAQDPKKLAAIAELTAGRDGIKIKTRDTLAAIRQLADMQGWLAAQKFDHQSSDGSMTPAKLDPGNLSDQALAEIMAARTKN